MKNIVIAGILTILLIAFACGNKSTDSSEGPKKPTVQKPKNDGRGVGQIKNVTLNETLNPAMVSKGQAIYDMKCAACHKMSAKRLVGPGFTGVTDRRKPEWIMNMITNVEIMLEQDPAAQKLLEECLTRMPNQNVSVGDARDILEFLLEHDVKEEG